MTIDDYEPMIEWPPMFESVRDGFRRSIRIRRRIVIPVDSLVAFRDGRDRPSGSPSTFVAMLATTTRRWPTTDRFEEKAAALENDRVGVQS